jgi:tRNA threonylcarbamoyladenosine biosynthesis protein TsaB
MGRYILHIDTSSSRGLVMISQSGKPITFRVNTNAFAHASFLQPAVKELLEELEIDKSEIICIAVANGPGSYTGLRVGLAAAKGLCYAWQLPLITLSSLFIMAKAMQDLTITNQNEFVENIAFVPMIDARRMEVFFALYSNIGLNTIIDPSPVVIDGNFLVNELQNSILYFSGDGASKWQNLCLSENARFINLPHLEHAFAYCAFQAALKQEWADIAYSEPFYKKDFYTPIKF